MKIWKAKAFTYCLFGRYNLLPVRKWMPEKIARVQATIYVTTHLSIAPFLAALQIQQEKTPVTSMYALKTSWPNAS